jgi:hypothetical protein
MTTVAESLGLHLDGGVPDRTPDQRRRSLLALQRTCLGAVKTKGSSMTALTCGPPLRATGRPFEPGEQSSNNLARPGTAEMQLRADRRVCFGAAVSAGRTASPTADTSGWAGVPSRS